jgi:processive 1,2-diacylglycerol beta-glucosyltransferase
MTACDILVGKPGGLSSSEALVCGTPFIINSPLPGQEERNSDYLLENGAAVKGTEIRSLILIPDSCFA